MDMRICNYCGVSYPRLYRKLHYIWCKEKYRIRRSIKARERE